MEKVLNINIGGRIIPVEEPAFSQLRKYMDWLKQFFSKESGGDEIYHDMEDRIAELFEDCYKKTNTPIAIADVASMMSIMGSPNELALANNDDLGETLNSSATTPNFTATAEEPTSKYENNSHFISESKTLTRIREGRMFTGLANGIAALLNVDVVIIRLIFIITTLFYGISFILYFICSLIIPIVEKAPNGFKRKLYRSKDDKLLGGVCAGLAPYFNISKQQLRLIVIAPILLTMVLNIIDWDDMNIRFVNSLIPIVLFSYVTLWILLPKAATLTQKMENQGVKIDVKNVHQALKDEQQKQYKEPLTTERAKKESGNGFNIIFKFLAYCGLAILLLLSAIIILPILFALIVAVFGVTIAGIDVLPLANILFENPIFRVIFNISGILFLLSNLGIFVYLIIRVFSKNKQKKRWILGMFSLIWIISLILFIFFGAKGFTGYKTPSSQIEQLSLAPILDNDTIVIKTLTPIENVVEDSKLIIFKDDKMLIKNVNLLVSASEDSLTKLSIERSARGKDYLEAEKAAMAIPFTYQQEKNILLFPPLIVMDKVNKFKFQSLNIELKIPVGKFIKFEKLPRSYANNSYFDYLNSSMFVNINTKPRFKDQSIYQMTEYGLTFVQ